MNFDDDSDPRLSGLTEEQVADARSRRYLLAALNEGLETTPARGDHFRAVLGSAVHATERRMALRAIEIRDLEERRELR